MTGADREAVETRLRSAMHAVASRQQVRAGAAGENRRRLERRGAKRRRAAAASAAAAVGIALVAGLALTSGEGRDTVQVAAQPSTAAPQACAAPPADSSVPDCPVDPSSVGSVGVPGYLPPEWALYAEEDVPFPTGTSERVQALSRRYKGEGPGFLLVTVYYGDVEPWPAADYQAQPDPVRDDVQVLRAGADGSPGGRYLWSAGPRVNVDAEFFETDLPDEEKRRIVQSIDSQFPR